MKGFLVDVHEEKDFPQVLSQKLANDYARALHYMRMILLLNAWLHQVRTIKTQDAPLFLSKFKTKFLSDSFIAQEKNILPQLYQFCKEGNYDTPRDLLCALEYQYKVACMHVRDAELWTKPYSNVDAGHSLCRQAFKSFYYVEFSGLLISAAEELYGCLNLPDTSSVINNKFLSTITKISHALLAYKLLCTDSRQNNDMLIYLIAYNLNQIACVQFNALHQIAKKFEGDESTVLRYLPILRHMGRYFLFMTLTVIFSGVNGFKAAHLNYGLSELVQYLHKQIASPYFIKLCQSYPQYQHILQIMHFLTLTLSLNSGGPVLETLAVQFPETLREISFKMMTAWKRAATWDDSKILDDELFRIQAPMLPGSPLGREAKKFDFNRV